MRIYAYWIKWLLITVGLLSVYVGGTWAAVVFDADDGSGLRGSLLLMLCGLLLFPIDWLLEAVAKRKIASKLVHPTYGIFDRPPSYRELLSQSLKSDEEARRLALFWLKSNFDQGVRWYLEQAEGDELI